MRIIRGTFDLNKNIFYKKNGTRLQLKCGEQVILIDTKHNGVRYSLMGTKTGIRFSAEVAGGHVQEEKQCREALTGSEPERKVLPQVLYEIACQTLSEYFLIEGQVDHEKVRTMLVEDDEPTVFSSGPPGPKPNAPGRGKLKITEVAVLKKDTIIIKGFCQSGKTAAMIDITLDHFFRHNYTTIIVLRNFKDDLNQLKSRFEHRVNQIKEKVLVPMVGRNVLTEDDFNKFKVPLINAKDVDKLTEALSCIKGPQVIVTIGHCSSLQNIVEACRRNGENNHFNIMIDEADENEHMNIGDEAQRAVALEELCENATRKFQVSATILDLFYKPCKNVFIYPMQAPKNYKGLRHINWMILEKEIGTSTQRRKDSFVFDKNFRKVIDKVAQMPVFVSRLKQGQKHPKTMLISTFNEIDAHHRMAQRVHQRTRAPVIVVNERGYLYSQNLGDIFIERHGKFLEYDGKGYVISAKVSAGNLLEWMRLNGGVERFPTIFTVAGKKADRGLSFVDSGYPNCKETGELSWHQQFMYLLCSNSTHIPRLIQKVGRVCGVFDDDLPITVYTTEKICQDAYRGLQLQDDILDRVRDENFSWVYDIGETERSYTFRCDEDVSEAVRKYQFSKEKVHSAARPTLMAGKVICHRDCKAGKKNVIKEFDGGMALEEYEINKNKQRQSGQPVFTKPQPPGKPVGEVLREKNLSISAPEYEIWHFNTDSKMTNAESRNYGWIEKVCKHRTNYNRENVVKNIEQLTKLPNKTINNALTTIMKKHCTQSQKLGGGLNFYRRSGTRNWTIYFA